MSDRRYNVLFLCTGNSARSILAESILRKDGAGRFNAFSAGSQPKRQINPFALKVLEAYRYPTDGVRPKSWDGRFVKEDYQRTVSAEFKDSRTPTERLRWR